MSDAAPFDPTTRPTPVDVRPVHSDLDRDLAQLEKLTNLLDAQFKVGGIEFGYDAIIGLVPVAGDVLTTLLALYPVYLARKHKLGRWTRLRMLGNVGLDFLLGFTPVLGDVADVAFKANKRNLALFRKVAEKHRGRRVGS